MPNATKVVFKALQILTRRSQSMAKHMWPFRDMAISGDAADEAAAGSAGAATPRPQAVQGVPGARMYGGNVYLPRDGAETAWHDWTMYNEKALPIPLPGLGGVWYRVVLKPKAAGAATPRPQVGLKPKAAGGSKQKGPHETVVGQMMEYNANPAMLEFEPDETNSPLIMRVVRKKGRPCVYLPVILKAGGQNVLMREFPDDSHLKWLDPEVDLRRLRDANALGYTVSHAIKTYSVDGGELFSIDVDGGETQMTPRRPGEAGVLDSASIVVGKLLPYTVGRIDMRGIKIWEQKHSGHGDDIVNRFEEMVDALRNRDSKSNYEFYTTHNALDTIHIVARIKHKFAFSAEQIVTFLKNTRKMYDDAVAIADIDEMADDVMPIDWSTNPEKSRAEAVKRLNEIEIAMDEASEILRRKGAREELIKSKIAEIVSNAYIFGRRLSRLEWRRVGTSALFDPGSAEEHEWRHSVAKRLYTINVEPGDDDGDDDGGGDDDDDDDGDDGDDGYVASVDEFNDKYKLTEAQRRDFMREFFAVGVHDDGDKLIKAILRQVETAILITQPASMHVALVVLGVIYPEGFSEEIDTISDTQELETSIVDNMEHILAITYGTETDIKDRFVGDGLSTGERADQTREMLAFNRAAFR